jgi:hypothetical protein
MTEAQRAALKWLRDHGGDGVFGKKTVVLAGGEWAPFSRSTWNHLRDAELVEFYGPPGGSGTRVRVTKFGVEFDCGQTEERRTIEWLGGPL